MPREKSGVGSGLLSLDGERARACLESLEGVRVKMRTKAHIELAENRGLIPSRRPP
jgi:hypothetical protein